MTDGLFALPGSEIAITSDDCYTPKWVFDAMGLSFDMDVAAPPGGPWHVPCRRYLTAADDGLSTPWSGLIWCNPPFSSMLPWAERFSAHPTGALMGLMLNRAKWLAPMLASADVVTLLPWIKFHAPAPMTPPEFRQVVFVAFRGVGMGPAQRLAAAGKGGAVLYGRTAA